MGPVETSIAVLVQRTPMPIHLRRAFPAPLARTYMPVQSVRVPTAFAMLDIVTSIAQQPHLVFFVLQDNTFHQTPLDHAPTSLASLELRTMTQIPPPAAHLAGLEPTRLPVRSETARIFSVMRVRRMWTAILRRRACSVSREHMFLLDPLELARASIALLACQTPTLIHRQLAFSASLVSTPQRARTVSVLHSAALQEPSIRI